eukprot:CAMPEP_0182473896 /NCGR_PEP_ID=MMETSP1319-20130603/24714_1 /TAXON_ID=172717 /ORGANISM="Bolidomonas pacifica, Strain RCC208" /LENGTH=135 /DNA_ID=CAMNT_0024674739 /DNA_START=94 /DNA_END=501 /DNA_ORIENTATION=-
MGQVWSPSASQAYMKVMAAMPQFLLLHPDAPDREAEGTGRTGLIIDVAALLIALDRTVPSPVKKLADRGRWARYEGWRTPLALSRSTNALRRLEGSVSARNTAVRLLFSTLALLPPNIASLSAAFASSVCASTTQ